MAVYRYSKFKILTDSESKKTQGLQVGDVVKRQYADNTQRLVYSLMVVLETGIDLIGDERKEAHYFVAALLEGDEPQEGELLDFVRVTSLTNPDRTGAIYLTASDDQSPFVDVIDYADNYICNPTDKGGNPDRPEKHKYAVVGEKYVTCSMKKEPSSDVANAYLRLSRNDVPLAANGSLAIKQSFELDEYASRVIVSYRVRAHVQQSVSVSLGYTTGSETDGNATIEVFPWWTYQLHIFTLDYAPDEQRSFLICLTELLQQENSFFEIADLHIIGQAKLVNLVNATKVRVGKVQGISDPVFGKLDGYGAYFQNLYATKNVNIAGTLTAGDENGFSSTFYVGKIHKNVIVNSIDCRFTDPSSILVDEKTPVGIGNVWKFGTFGQVYVQSSEWRETHAGQLYCFSCWVKGTEGFTLAMYQNEHSIGESEIIATAFEWKRIHVSFRIQPSEAADLSLRLYSSKVGVLFTAPQLEAGGKASQYQPTDGVLSPSDDYGAWFSKGGIGGTIQNPLLRLNKDGSISSRDNSFVINPDGTGYFASGRFRWTKDAIILQDVTIRWEDFSDDAKDEILPCSVSVESTNGTIFRNGVINTLLKAIVYKGSNDITDQIPDENVTWTRLSNDLQSDELWNAQEHKGKVLEVTERDVYDKAVFDCEVVIA